VTGLFDEPRHFGYGHVHEAETKQSHPRERLDAMHDAEQALATKGAVEKENGGRRNAHDEVFGVAVQRAHALETKRFGDALCRPRQFRLNFEPNADGAGQQVHEHDGATNTGTDVYEYVIGRDAGALDDAG
jgi:hypothetical protein